MSSRLGGVPTAQEILENVGELVKKESKTKMI